jgi:DNA polymerase-3 subunit gamma/tau
MRALAGGAAPAGARAPAKPAPAQRTALHSSIDEPDEAADDESGLGDNDEGLDEPGPIAEGVPMLRSFAEVVDYAGARREAKLKVHLEEHVSLVKFDPAGSIELHLLAGAPKELGNELREKLNAWTGGRWMVALSKAPGERPLGEVAREREAAELREIEQHPAVAAILQEFPDARITSVKPLAGLKKDDTGTG